MPYLQSFNRFDVHKDFPFCSENAAGCRTWVTGPSEKYVVSDPIFDEEEIEKATATARRSFWT